jgi:hypothetical protein
MSKAVTASRKRGRPTVGSLNIGVRVPPDQLAALDAWIAKQPDPKPSRPEAIRQLVDQSLAPVEGPPTISSKLADDLGSFA